MAVGCNLSPQLGGEFLDQRYQVVYGSAAPILAFVSMMDPDAVLSYYFNDHRGLDSIDLGNDRNVVSRHMDWGQVNRAPAELQEQPLGKQPRGYMDCDSSPHGLRLPGSAPSNHPSHWGIDALSRRLCPQHSHWLGRT